MSRAIRILYVDDNPFDRELVRDALEKEHGGFDLTTVASRLDFEGTLAGGGFDLILSDFNILGFDGLQVIDLVHAQKPELPVIIVTGTGSEIIAVEALKRGAADYVIKTPAHIRRLPLAIHAVLEKRRADRALHDSRAQMAGIFDTMMDALITVDEEQIIVAFNPAAEQMYRCKASEVIGHSLERFLPELVRPDHTALLYSFGEANSTARTMKSSALALTCLRADGEPFASEVSISQLNIGGKRLFTAIVRDVTERNQAEARLRESEQRFQTLARVSPVGIFRTDATGSTTYVNPKWCTISGLSAEEALGDGWLDAVHPDDKKTLIQGWQASTEQQQTSLSEYRFMHPDGTIAWVMGQAVPELNLENQIVGYVGTITDITERKLAEQQMQLLTASLEAAANSIVITDRAGVIQWVNPAWSKMTGYSLAEAVGQKPNILKSGIQSPDYYREMWETILAGESWQGELINRRKDGSLYPEEEIITPVRDAKGEITHFIGVKEDITERKRAEETLRASEDSYRDLVENSHDVICTHDLQGNMLSVNPATARISGYSVEELLGMNVFDILAPVDRKDFPTYLAAIQATGSASHRMAILTKSGEQRVWAYDSTLRTEGVHEPIVRNSARDITEQLRAEEALANEKKLLRTLIDHLPDSIYAKDIEGRFILKNIAGAGLLGAATPDEAIGKTDFDFYAPEMAAEFYADDQSVIQSGQSIINHEELVTGATGHSTWLSTTKVPLRDLQGNIIGLVGIGHDITERRRAQARIETQLERLAALHAIDVAITSNRDLAQTLDVALEQAITHLGLDAACVLLIDSNNQTLTHVAGRGFRTSLSEEKPVILGQGLMGQAVMEGRVVWADEISQVQDSPRLTAMWADEGFSVYHGIPLIAKDRIIGLMEVFRRTPRASDAEWRSFLETLAGQAAIAVDNATLFAEIQAQVQLTQQIIDNAPEGMVLLDREQRLVLANPTALAIVPALAQLATGDLVTALDDQPLSAFLPELGSGQLRHELTLNHPLRILEVAAQPLTAGPHSGGKLLVMWDVTAERTQQRYQQAQERLATVGQMAAGIAHDFNNIMGAIVLYAQMLRKSPNLTDRQQGQLATIQDQAHHATNLIRQILDFSRRSVMEKAPVDLSPLVKELIKLLERTLPENIRSTLDYDRNEYAVFGDATRLQQVLMNLALNARDAMPSGGDLRFALSVISTTPHQPPPLPDMTAGEWVCLMVSDTGAGIDAADLPHIFEPFFTTKFPGQGTGLGLAQVYGIVKQHDGFLTVNSQVKQGTTFIIYLPLFNSPQPLLQESKEDAVISRGSETILLVEDNPAMRQSVADSLEGLGYRVLCAEDGVAALEVLAQEEASSGAGVDLVLSDLVMPRMGGAELTTALALRYPTIKILIMTGHPLNDGHQLLQQMGKGAWIQKPFKMDTLSDRIRDLLGPSTPDPASPG